MHTRVRRERQVLPFTLHPHRLWLLSYGREGARLNDLATIRYDVVHEAVVLGLVGGEITIAIGVALDALHRLARVPRKQLVHLGAEIENLLRLNLDVRC